VDRNTETVIVQFFDRKGVILETQELLETQETQEGIFDS